MRRWISLALVVLCGCAPQNATLEQRRNSLEHVMADRADALAAVLHEHTVLVLTGDQPQGWGSGTILTADGYIITAAHCLRPNRPTWIAHCPPCDMTLIPARVVWVGNPRSSFHDVAILKVEAERLKPLEWAEDNAFPATTIVGVAGFSTKLEHRDAASTKVVSPLFSAGAGKIDEHRFHSSRKDAPQSALVTFSAPIGRGDSGGPLVTSEGKLIAVNRGWIGVMALSANPLKMVSLRMPFCAVRPDPAWVAQVIEADRRAHLATSPTAPLQPLASDD